VNRIFSAQKAEREEGMSISAIPSQDSSRRRDSSVFSDPSDDAAAAARPPGLHDVGRMAGVSHQTVSRVLNNQPNVKPETRQRVLDAISTLGYRRNSAARALATRRSGIIGILTTASPLFGPTSTLLAVEWAARDAGYFVSVAGVPVQDIPSIEGSLDRFLSQSVEGVVVIAPQDFAAEALSSLADSIPTVLIADSSATLGKTRSVSVDQAAGAAMAVAHLVEVGYRSVAHIAGPEDWFDARARIDGWRRGIAAHGLPTLPIIYGDWSAASGYRAACSLMKSGLPEAVFAANDGMALGMLRAFRERGVKVPADLSIVGFDDVLGAAYYDPPLTTVRQDFEALGTLAVRTLQETLDNRAPQAEYLKIKPRLVVRMSSGAASQFMDGFDSRN
jgi:DNA-binding LacI/PurR family transcriptional regulator